MEKWTKEQRQAIESRVPELSVSASAGSGKTSTMVARIVNLLQHGSANVGELLVLTFTNESARDMRAKLSRGLEQRIGEVTDGGKRNYLVRQLLDLAAADIGTFHSFCGLVVRQWFSAADVNPNFSVIDEIESGKMKADIFEKMLVDCYDGAAKSAIDRFAMNRNFDALRDTVLDMHNFLESREDREKWLGGTAAKCYTVDPNKNDAIKLLIDHYKKLAEFYRDKFIEFGYNSAEPQHIVYVANIITTISCYDDLYEFANTDMKIKQIEKGAPDQYKDLREDFKKNVFNEIKNNFKNYPAEELKNSIKNDREIIEGLIYLVREFGARYSHRKLEKNRMDFADLEKYTLRVLTDPVALAGVRAKYKYIFVDEGQDTNPVQFDIVKKLIYGDDGVENFFMVGDVKQSIYGFRGCEPDMFEREIAKSNTAEHESISFNDNFRSNPEILRFVNDIFCPIMKRPNYAADGKFKTGSPYADEKFKPVEIEIIDMGRTDDEADGNDGRAVSITEPYDITADNTDGGEARAVDAQIAAAVRHIHGLIGAEYCVSGGGKKKFGLGDIAVLAESRTHFSALAEALRASGINCAVDEKVHATEISETAMLHNFLFAVSNWTNDLPLVLTMRSVAFGFTDDEIARVRLTGRDLPFIECIKKYIVGGTDAGLKKRLTAFTEMLTKYHALVRTQDTATVLLTFMTEFKYLERLDSRGGVGAVYSFIQKIKNLSAADSPARYLYLIEHELIKVEVNLGAAADDAVRIMTIHGAKGLEFPAVILFNTTAPWSGQGGRKSPVTVDKDFGICIQSADAENYIQSNGILQLAVKTRQRAKELDEKMRLLYVAVTRPKNHLFITGAKNMSNAKRYLTDTPFAKCMFDLIYAGVAIAGRGGEGGEGTPYPLGADTAGPVGMFCGDVSNTRSLPFEVLHDTHKTPPAAGKEHGVVADTSKRLRSSSPKTEISAGGEGGEETPHPLGAGTPIGTAEAVDKKLVDKLKSAFAWEYPHRKITETHIKQSVTSLTRAENETLDFAAPMKFDNPDRSGAEYGTAFHKKMQYEMSAERSDGRCASAGQVVSAGKGGSNDAADKDVAAAAEIINKFLAGWTVYREFPFLSAMPDGTMVQGIIDLLAVRGKEAVIIDYKTTRADEKRLVEIYTPQLRLYAEAAAKFLPDYKISAMIYSTRRQKLITVPL